MKENLKTFSSAKISEKILHSPTVIKYVEYCKIKLLAKKDMYSKDKGENGMRDVVRDEEIIVEILEKCNWRQKIVVKRNKKLILNIYHYARINTVNKILS